MARNFGGKFPENPKIVEFLKDELFNRKIVEIPGGKAIGPVIPGKKFSKFQYSSQDCLQLRKFWKLLFFSSLAISGDFQITPIQPRGDRGEVSGS